MRRQHFSRPGPPDSIIAPLPPQSRASAENDPSVPLALRQMLEWRLCRLARTLPRLPPVHQCLDRRQRGPGRRRRVGSVSDRRVRRVVGGVSDGAGDGLLALTCISPPPLSSTGASSLFPLLLLAFSCSPSQMTCRCCPLLDGPVRGRSPRCALGPRLCSVSMAAAGAARGSARRYRARAAPLPGPSAAPVRVRALRFASAGGAACQRPWASAQPAPIPRTNHASNCTLDAGCICSSRWQTAPAPARPSSAARRSAAPTKRRTRLGTAPASLRWTTCRCRPCAAPGRCCAGPASAWTRSVYARRALFCAAHPGSQVGFATAYAVNRPRCSLGNLLS
jgi:hypothetical protein